MPVCLIPQTLAKATHTGTQVKILVSIPDTPVSFGTYQHYKGGIYALLGVCLLNGDTVVIYQAWDGDSLRDAPIYARPWNEWAQLVEWPDGVRRTRFSALPPCPVENSYFTGPCCTFCGGLAGHKPMATHIPAAGIIPPERNMTEEGSVSMSKESKPRWLSGEVVRLKSGGPLMTVQWVSADNTVAHTTWFPNEGVAPMEGEFIVYALEAVSPRDEKPLSLQGGPDPLRGIQDPLRFP